MWLRTKKGELVNMDRVGVVEITEHPYGVPCVFRVYGKIQETSNEDVAIYPRLFDSANVIYCQEFVKWLYEQLAIGVRVADVAQFLAPFESEDV